MKTILLLSHENSDPFKIFFHNAQHISYYARAQIGTYDNLLKQLVVPISSAILSNLEHCFAL